MSQRPSLHLFRTGAQVASAPRPLDGAAVASSSGPKSRRRLRLHVTLGFLISAALPGLARGWRGMVLWGTIVVASLVTHELGHALVGLLSGSRVTIVMYPLGGATRMDPPLARGRSVVADLTGPLVSLTLGVAAAWLRARLGHPAWLTIGMWVNLGWAALNLLPVPPLDGGQVLLKAMGSERAAGASAIAASVAAGVAMTGFVVVRSAALSAVFAGAAVYSMLEWVKRRQDQEEARLDLPTRLQGAERLLAQGRPVQAQVLATVVIQAARSKKTRRQASELLAWCLLLQERPERAREALIAAGPLPALDAHCRAAVEEACGREELAIEILERARHREGLGREAIKSLVDLYARRGRFDLVCRVAGDEFARLGADDTRRVLWAALDAGAFAGATEIAGVLCAATARLEDSVAHAYALARNNEASRALERLRELAGAPIAPMSQWALSLLYGLAREPQFAAAVEGLLEARGARSTA